MGLKRLTIKNIGSITSKTIDFEAEPLNSASLFLITGPTGSGKSIILDCICLALYGKAARLEKIRSQDKYYDSGFNCSQDGSISLDDPRQLVRRGTVEALAELVFTGTDGVEYTASWSVSRGERAKVTQRLSPEKRRISSADGSVLFTKVAEVNQFIQSPGVVGMKFEEFCRTCLLAQGDFTKFLDSKTEEKANILEKVTGTEKFSKIGKAINEKYVAIRKDADKLRENLADKAKIPMNPEDRASIEQELVQKENDRERLLEQKKSLSAKKIILDRKDILDAKEKRAHERFGAATASQKSEGYLNARKTSADWKVSAEARADLKKKQRALADKENSEIKMAGYTGTFRKLCGEFDWLKDSIGIYRDIDAEIIAKKAGIDKKETQKRALHPEVLAAEGDALSKDKKVLERILRQAVLWKSSRNSTVPQVEVSAFSPDKKKLYDDAFALASTAWTAQDRLALSQSKYNEVFSRFQDHAEAIRSTLKKGDTCPVCGNIVKSILTSERITEILRPLQDDITMCQTEVKRAWEEYEKAIEAISTAYGKANDAITDWQKRNGQVTDIANAITEMTRELGELNARLTEKTRIEEAIKRIGMVRDDIILKLKAEAPESVPGKENRMLESDWNTLRDNINNTGAQISTAQKEFTEASSSLGKFFEENPGFTPELLVSLSAKKQTDIDLLDINIKKVDDAVVAAAAIIESCGTERKDLEKEIFSGKYTFSEEDTSESLEKEIKALENCISDIDRRRGEIKNEIAGDNDKIAAAAEEQKKLDAITPELKNYETLNSLFGQSDGALFKRIAQSHLLGVLLENANYYMSQFNDRYELTRQEGSLVVLIRDKEQDGIPRPVNTLSGGEGFMASLALALGLSSLSSNNLTLETLFIDEGFGTLSPNCLTKVHQTLSSLKKVVGKKVGIISHVEELKEQIHPQIAVEPVGNGISVIHDPA